MSSARGTILVVDDSEEVVDWVKLVLGRVGYTVLTAPNGARGLELLRHTRPEVVLLDMMMPELDGLAFLDQLRAAPAGPRPGPTIIACSGFEAFERLALERGARGFLRKPYEGAELLKVVEAALHDGEIAPALDANPARVEAARAQAGRARQALLDRLALDDEGLRAQTRDLVSWAVGYFEVRRAFVTALHGDRLLVIAEVGGAPQFPAGCAMDPSVNFCPDVIDAGARMVLTDTTTHPVYAGHAAAAASRFYAGAPLLTPDGLSLGTFCVEDNEPIAFHAEDLAVIGQLAVAVGHYLHALSVGGTPIPLFSAPRLFGPPALEALLAAELRRAERDRTVVELALVDLRNLGPSTLEEVGFDLAGVPDRRHFAAALDEAGGIALVTGGVSREVVRRRTEAAIGAFTWRHPALGAGAARFAGGGGGALDLERIVRTARDALALATRAGDGKTHRLDVPQA